MRTLLFLIVAASAIAGTGARSEASDLQTGPIYPGYRIKAEFSGSLLVSWGFSENTEGKDNPCSFWVKGGGISKFQTSSIRPAPGYLQGFGPRHAGNRRPGQSWASMSVLGNAKGKVERSITIHDGGVNWNASCVGTRPRRPESIDCGERLLPRMRAILVALDSKFTGMLEPPELAPLGSSDDLVFFSIGASREPFGSCAPSYAGKPPQTFLRNAALRVTRQDKQKLVNLGRGKSHRLADHYGGRCSEDVSPRDCSFVLDLELKITRL